MDKTLNMELTLSAIVYEIVYHVIVAVLSIATILYYINSNDKKIIHVNNLSSVTSLIFAIIAVAFFVVFIGYRPISYVFVDMIMYAHSYMNIITDYAPVDFSTEWLWHNITYFCKKSCMRVEDYFAVCEILYIVPLFVGCILLMRRNIWPAILLVFSSFSFYGYAVNGIRNGVACSFVFLAIAMLTINKRSLKIISLLTMLTAYSIHHSTILPSLCAIFSWSVVKQPKYAIGFWLLAILISMIFGNFVGNIFAGLGFDDRTSYFQDASLIEEGKQFSSTGFRLDFLLYSAIPVIFVWYLCVLRQFKDEAFNLIANTYILSNAFWVMVIRATFSNRFAYLSWFLYPLVIAYPLLRMNIWEMQDRNSALIILAYTSFTLFMFFIYYG